MTDVVDKQTRSRMMSGIRNKDTAPELIVRRYLHGFGFRYRLHAAALTGKPDLVLPKYRVVVFVNGCFWHRHKKCKLAYMPKTNIESWMAKFSSNVRRDQLNREALLREGWRVITVWECGLRKTTGNDLAWLPFAIENENAGSAIEWPVL